MTPLVLLFVIVIQKENTVSGTTEKNAFPITFPLVNRFLKLNKKNLTIVVKVKISGKKGGALYELWLRTDNSQK